MVFNRRRATETLAVTRVHRSRLERLNLAKLEVVPELALKVPNFGVDTSDLVMPAAAWLHTAASVPGSGFVQLHSRSFCR